MNSKHILACLGASVAMASASLGQGADLCANAQSIAGLGFFNFDNSLATTDGSPDPLCSFFGQTDVANDVWFSWVAPSDGTFTVETCGLTTVDTKIGIYAGGCAGIVVACNDDACGSLQSSLSWGGLTGNTYLIRLGNYPTAVGGTGQFEVREEVPTINPANGHGYTVVTATLSWDAANAAAQTFSYAGATGHLVTIADQAELNWMLANLAFNRPWIGLFQDLQDPNYSEPAGGWVWVTGEPNSFFNWASGEPNNTSATAGPENYAEMFATGVWNDAELNHAQTSQYMIEFDVAASGDPYCAGDGSATCPCFGPYGLGVGCVNSVGPGAGLVASGSAQVSNDTFFMDVTGAPASAAGLIVKGSVQMSTPVGDGFLCTSPELRSHVQFTDALGATTFTQFDNQAFGVTANMGSTTYYQFWYRDPANVCGGGFNFSNGWETNWLP